jgi:hypothetical protein
MANAFYSRAKQGFIAKELDQIGDAPQIALIDSADYTFSAAHTSYASDVAAGAKVASVVLPATLTETDGVFDSGDGTWSSVTGDECEALINWLDTPTTPVADPLIAFWDTGMSGMPVTPNGGDINFTVNGSGWWEI